MRNYWVAENIRIAKSSRTGRLSVKENSLFTVKKAPVVRPKIGGRPVPLIDPETNDSVRLVLNYPIA
jgi:hypothetical protein